VEYVVGLSSDAAQLVFVGNRGARFGQCRLVLKSVPDYFMQFSVGEQARENIAALEEQLEVACIEGNDVQEWEGPEPTLSNQEIREIEYHVFPFVARLVAGDYSSMGVTVNKDQVLWTYEQPGDGRLAQSFAVDFQSEEAKLQLFKKLRLLENEAQPRMQQMDHFRNRTGISAQAFQWHGSGVESGWDLPICVAETSKDARPGYDTQDGSEYVDQPETLKRKVSLLAAMLRKSRMAVIYTGAGISTAAGIGDYASNAPGSLAPHKRSSKSSGSRLDLKPTFSHHALAAMAEAGLLKHWLQQNHDRLPQKAGFPQERINEIHGAWGDDKNMVKMMDDTLRDDLLQWMEKWGNSADICLALGTTLCGMNADQVAQACAERHLSGEPGQQGLVIINLQRTPMDAKSSLRIWGVLDDVFSMLAKELKLKVPSKARQAQGSAWESQHPRCKYNTPKRSVKSPM
jgi:NAD-dependent SIR2 family protein deacetylase